MRKTMNQCADRYARERATGNSWIDDKMREAFVAGALAAVKDLGERLDPIMPEYYKRVMNERSAKMFEK